MLDSGHLPPSYRLTLQTGTKSTLLKEDMGHSFLSLRILVDIPGNGCVLSLCMTVSQVLLFQACKAMKAMSTCRKMIMTY